MRLRRATPLGPGVWGSQSRAGSALHKTLTLRVHTVMPISLRQGGACGGVCVCVCVCVCVRATTKCGAPGCPQRSLSLLRECWRLLEGGVSEAPPTSLLLPREAPPTPCPLQLEAPPTPCPLRRAAALCQPRASVPLREFWKDSSSGDGPGVGLQYLWTPASPVSWVWLA